MAKSETHNALYTQMLTESEHVVDPDNVNLLIHQKWGLDTDSLSHNYSALTNHWIIGADYP